MLEDMVYSNLLKKRITKLLCTCITAGLFGIVALSREASCMALPYLLFFHLLLQNELPQTGLNLQTRILIRVTQLSKAFGKTDVLHLILTVFVDGEATRPTLLRCSSWSSFLFKASSSSSSLDLLLPSEPTGSKHKPKKNR